MTTECAQQTTALENVKIRRWTADPQPIGCSEYCGLYYYNRVSNNTQRPDIGAGTGTYVGGFDLCGLIDYLAGLAAHHQGAGADQQLAQYLNIQPFNHDDNKKYRCGEWVLYKGNLYSSLAANNDAPPTDTTKWRKAGLFTDLLNKLLWGDQPIPCCDAAIVTPTNPLPACNPPAPVPSTNAQYV